MTIKELKNELRLVGIKYDPWATVMDAWFECAGRMNRRHMDIPSEWNYKPPMGGDGTDKESYWYSLFARCSNKQLNLIGAYLYKLTNILEKAGKSY